MNRDRLRGMKITNILTDSGDLSGQLMTGDQGLGYRQPTAHDHLIGAAESCGTYANQNLVGRGCGQGHLLKLDTGALFDQRFQ